MPEQESKQSNREKIIRRPDCGQEQDCEKPQEECLCCTHRKKERSEQEYKDLIHRLNRIEGQIRGIRGMIERGAYCPDILVQSAAAGAALNSFNRVLLANHIKSCVIQDIKDGKEETIEELLATLQKLMK